MTFTEQNLKTKQNRCYNNLARKKLGKIYVIHKILKTFPLLMKQIEFLLSITVLNII